MSINLRKIATIDTLQMKPRDYQENGNPNSGLGYNYLYEIIGLGDYVSAFRDMRLVKNGYAKEFYSTGHNGLFQRVRTTVREFEKTFCNGEFGAIYAIVYGNVCKEANRSLAQEQYVHKRNQGGPDHLLNLIVSEAEKRGKEAPAGKTEIYNWNPRSAYGRYLQSMTKKAIGEGWDDIVAHNFRGQSGWKLPVTSNTLEV